MNTLNIYNERNAIFSILRRFRPVKMAAAVTDRIKIELESAQYFSNGVKYCTVSVIAVFLSFECAYANNKGIGIAECRFWLDKINQFRDNCDNDARLFELKHEKISESHVITKSQESNGGQDRFYVYFDNKSTNNNFLLGCVKHSNNYNNKRTVFFGIFYTLDRFSIKLSNEYKIYSVDFTGDVTLVTGDELISFLPVHPFTGSNLMGETNKFNNVSKNCDNYRDGDGKYNMWNNKIYLDFANFYETSYIKIGYSSNAMYQHEFLRVYQSTKNSEKFEPVYIRGNSVLIGATGDVYVNKQLIDKLCLGVDKKIISKSTLFEHRLCNLYK